LRQGSRVRTRLAERDAYAFLLVAIFVTIVFFGLGRSTGAFAIALQGATLLFGLWTSGVRRRRRQLASGLVVIAIVLAVLNAGHHNRALEVATSACGVLLAIGAIGAILRRVRQRLRIDVETIYAAMSVYLLIGLTYSYLFGLIAASSDQPFFAGDHAPIVAVNFVYFSFVTLTTVGYGDFTAAQPLGQMIAVSEAVIGQLYLVSVIGLVVGNFGQPRQDRKHD
jgi:voltage-gated potassium channel Kch